MFFISCFKECEIPKEYDTSKNIVILRNDLNSVKFNNCKSLHDNTLITLPDTLKNSLSDTYSIWWVMSNLENINIDDDTIGFVQYRRYFVNAHADNDHVALPNQMLGPMLYDQYLACHPKVYFDIFLEVFNKYYPNVDALSIAQHNYLIQHNMFLMSVDNFKVFRNILLPMLNDIIDEIVKRNLVVDRILGQLMERITTILLLCIS